MRYRHHGDYHPVRIVRSETFVVSFGTIKVLAFLYHKKQFGNNTIRKEGKI